MATEYDVRAKLHLTGVQQAKKQADSFAGSVERMQTKIRGTQSAMGGMVKQALLMGGAYMGFSAIARTFTGLSSSAIKYTSDLERTKIGLTSVLSAVNEVDWNTGQKQAENAFEMLKEMSITSPAGPQDMFNIFQGIVGPLRAAGTEMDRIYQMTNSTVLASSALGVDFEQAQRDISLMARGTAGMDTKMFSLLRSTGAIAETTEQWNRGLTAAQRVTKLEQALGKFAGSGDAFGKSWAGLTSTFKGIVNELKRAAFTPIMQALQNNLAKINDYMIENRVTLEMLMNTYGTKVAGWIESAAQTSAKAFQYLTDNWSTIVRKFEHAMSILKKYGPMVGKMAAGKAAVDMARGPAAGLFGVAAQGVGMASSLAGGGAASGGGAAAGGLAAAGSAALLPVFGVLAALAAVATAVYANWQPIVDFLGDTLSEALSSAADAGQAAWSLLEPMLVGVGTMLLMVLVPAFKLLLQHFTGIMKVISPILKVFGALAKLQTAFIVVAFEKLMETLSYLGDHLGFLVEPAEMAMAALDGAATAFTGFVDSVLGDLAKVRAEADAAQQALQNGLPMDSGVGPLDLTPYILKMNAEHLSADPNGSKSKKKSIPGGRGGSTVNVQKMIIRQDFKNKDPDRIVAQMMSDITKQAESRVSSRYRGALTG